MAVVAIAVLATGLLVARLIADGSTDDGWVAVGPVDEMRRERVTFLPDLDAYVVADATAVPRTLWARSPHLGGRIAYCESSTWFEDVAHGSKFDHRGRYVLGPAPRGLDRLPTEVHDGQVWVRTNHLVLGPPRNTGSVEPPPGPFCSTGV